VTVEGRQQPASLLPLAKIPRQGIRERRGRNVCAARARPRDAHLRPRAQRCRAKCDAALSDRVCARRDRRDDHWYCSRFSNLTTIVLAVVLAFLFGYALTSLPLLRAGLALAAVIPIALASDTLSIAVMEIVDNAIILLVPDAMDAGLGSVLFWGSLAFALAVAGAFAFPVNRWLIARGKGHTAVHETGIHGGPPTRLVAAAVAVAFIFGASVLVAEVIG
jgi:hypothetical protein